MGLLGWKSAAGGFMDEIRCDEQDYLIWKWRPYKAVAGDNTRENAIRFGSSLRVKDGEVAVFVYTQRNGMPQDFIEGPCDVTLETKNLPILASIIGLAYEGGTPFQAEVYFINLARLNQVQFGVPYFDVFDPTYSEFSVPVAVRGTISFNISDYIEFISLHRLAEFDRESFKRQIRDTVTRYVKGTVINLPKENNISVVQIESQIETINEKLGVILTERLEKDFGISVTSVDIAHLEIDKNSEGYKHLISVTRDMRAATIQAETEAKIKNINDMQRINAEDTEEKLRIQREEAQYAQHLNTQANNLQVHQLNQQVAVGLAGAEALGQMGVHGGAEVSGNGGMNPAAMMTGMAMGGVIGQNIAGSMNNMMQGMNNPIQTPPPIPAETYHVVIDGKDGGAFDMKALADMAAKGTISTDTLVWTDGMETWLKAGEVAAFSSIFTKTSTPPPIPQ